MSNRVTITAYSVPDYDNWGPDTYWTPQNWIDWHKALIAEYGKENGNRKFIEAWHDGPTFLVARADYLSFQPAFIAYMEKVGIYDQLNNGIGKLISDSTRVVAETPGAVVDTVQNSVSVIKWLVPVVIVVLVVLAILWLRARMNMMNNLV